MNLEAGVYGVAMLSIVFGFGAFIGAEVSGPAWAFRQRRRELEHTEKMALIAQRDRLLALDTERTTDTELKP